MKNEDERHSLYLDTAELLALREKDYDAFINKLYETIVKDPQVSIEDDEDGQKKEAAIQVLIDYYTKYEEFERCQKLFDIQKVIRGEES